jgi:hypothetical protein
MLKKDNKTKYHYVASYISDDGSADSLSFESIPEEVDLNFFKTYCEERGIDCNSDELSEFERTYPVKDRVYTVVGEVEAGEESAVLLDAIKHKIESVKISLITLDRVNALIDAVYESCDPEEYKEVALLQILMEKFSKRTTSEEYPDNIMKYKDVFYQALADLDPQETWESMFYELGKIRAYKEILGILERKE